MVDKKRCQGCRYLGTLSSAIGKSGPCCDYCYLTGHSLLKLPPREDGRCPAYEAGERKRMVVQPKVSRRKPKPWSGKYSHTQLLALYRQGLNDAQIAKEIGAVPSTVRKWRHRNELPHNYRREDTARGGETDVKSA